MQYRTSHARYIRAIHSRYTTQASHTLSEHKSDSTHKTHTVPWTLGAGARRPSWMVRRSGIGAFHGTSERRPHGCIPGPMAAFRAPWLHSGPHGSTAGPMAALRARNSRRCPGAEKASAGKRDSASSRRRPAPAAVRTTGLTMLRLLTDTHHTGSPPSTVERAGACATGR